MKAPEIEAIQRNAEHGSLLAHTMWLRANALGDPDEEARLYRLMSLFKSIQESAEMIIKAEGKVDARSPE